MYGSMKPSRKRFFETDLVAIRLGRSLSWGCDFVETVSDTMISPLKISSTVFAGLCRGFDRGDSDSRNSMSYPTCGCRFRQVALWAGEFVLSSRASELCPLGSATCHSSDLKSIETMYWHAKAELAFLKLTPPYL